MSDHPTQSSANQFLLVEDAARSLNLDAKVLRQGIACGLVPMRKDNIGIVRVHLGEVPTDLEDRIHRDDLQPELQVVVLADEVLNLEKIHAESERQHLRLVQLIEKQGTAIARYSTLLENDNSEFTTPKNTNSGSPGAVSNLLEQRDSEILKLSNILERTFRAIETRDQQVAAQTDQLTGTADKAIKLLERAVREGELSAEQLHMLNKQITASTSSSVRLENELDERNTVISNQNTLMERLVAIAEQSVSGASTRKRPKRSFWQRLFGGGKGI